MEEAFYQTVRVFNLADKYQIPVTILTDQYLADTSVSIPPYDFSKIKNDRHKRWFSSKGIKFVKSVNNFSR